MHFVKSKWFLIILGTVIWSITMVKSGLNYQYGLGFWGPNGHDGVWHVALINSLARGSLEMPIFAGKNITNYHIGFDLLLAVAKRLTTIPAHTLYFQLLPPLLALGIGLTVYKFVKNWQKSDNAAWWVVFFVYFGTSWGWLVNLFRVGDFGGESMFWSQQGISTLINPPFALSVLILFLGFIFLQQRRFWPAVITLALLSQIKIYAALLLFLVWPIAALLYKDKFLLKSWFVSFLISCGLYFPLNASSSQIIVWEPGWFLQTMMAVSDRVNWPRFYEAMINYRLANNWPKFAAAYLVAFIIFVFGNLGVRAIGVSEFVKKNFWHSLFLGITILGFLTPMFVLQSGTPWNTIQFSYYSLLFSAVVAGVVVAKVNSKLLMGVVVLASVAGTWGTLQHYLPSRPPAQISNRELEALNFLAKQPEGTVLTVPFDRNAADAAVNNPPRPLYLYESTAYVSAFTDKPVFMEDEVNLNITGFDWNARRTQAIALLNSQNPETIKKFWQDNDISYVYFLPEVQLAFGDNELGATQIFDNGQFRIWKINE